MKKMPLCDILTSHSYPGRGIVLGKSQDGSHAFIAYFIMGRSENSRNRIFETTPDGIRTRAFDESKMTDPSLIIYHPVRKHGSDTIVTNGDQTDTIYHALIQGGDYISALKTRCFEPDPPNLTPRISGIMRKNGDYVLSILKSGDGDETVNHRFFFEYENPAAGTAHFIHTYEENVSPLPSFYGEPRCVCVAASDAATLSNAIWNALDSDNKVSLFVRFINLATGEEETVIQNKHC